MADPVSDTLNVFRKLPFGKYTLRVSEDDPTITFPPNFSWRNEGKLFVVFPEEEENRRYMGVSVPKK